MNPRILKKLCKRAAPIVAKACPSLDKIIYEDEINGITVDRKHIDHWSGKPNEFGYFTPRKGTIGYGAVSGYFEAEWEDEPAYLILLNLVCSAHIDWDSFDYDSGEHPTPSIRIKTPSDVFANAQIVIDEAEKRNLERQKARETWMANKESLAA